MFRNIGKEKLFNQFKLWLFDCDGVILDSNLIKSEAFAECVASFGESNSKKLVEYHKANGGISRFKKFDYFQSDILMQPIDADLSKSLCEQYGRIVFEKLIECPYTEGFLELVDKLCELQKTLFVVSGGFQDELREVFKKRKTDHFFKGIFGSPASKIEIVGNILSEYTDKKGVFIGDAKADWEVANKYSLQFYFVEKYTEAHTWLNSPGCPKMNRIATLKQIL